MTDHALQNAPLARRATGSKGTAVTPADLSITPRDLRFGREPDFRRDRWWADGDPFATAMFNALSVTFPKGEAFFVEAVKAHRDFADPKLAEDIRAFVQQEVMHSREHVAFNRRVLADGYDISRLEARVDQSLELTRGRPVIANLLATICLEHFTAIFAHRLLADSAHLARADAEEAALWRWHAIEEIEHKGVAYDTYLAATRDWSGWKRWKTRSIVMLIVSWQFLLFRYEGMLDLLAQDGIVGRRAARGVLGYLLGRPGLLRRSFPAWIAWFRPGFHPWQHDDRALIATVD